MRKLIVFGCLAFSLNGVAQFELASAPTPVKTYVETPAGAVTGTVLTTDNQPASFVCML